jgi:uncharacterized membrane protein YcaP (DUF421 family)
MVNLCKYKNIFGKPREGVHSIRILDIAIVDVLATIISAFLFAKLFNLSFLTTLVILFLLGILMHWLFCVETTVNVFLRNSFYNLKPKR